MEKRAEVKWDRRARREVIGGREYEVDASFTQTFSGGKNGVTKVYIKYIPWEEKEKEMFMRDCYRKLAER